MTKHMTATEVLAREKALLSKPNPEFDAATQRAFGPMVERLKAKMDAAVEAGKFQRQPPVFPASQRGQDMLELNETIRKMK